MTHVTCRLTAKNRDQLRNPTLGNRVWATFTFLYATRRDYATKIRPLWIVYKTSSPFFGVGGEEGGIIMARGRCSWLLRD